MSSGRRDTPSAVKDLAAGFLDKVFPFHIVLDEGLTILDMGPSLRKFCPEVTAGSPLSALARVVTPHGVTSFAEMRARRDALFVLDTTSDGLKLRGQLLHDADDGILLFVGSPWVTDLASMAELGLTLGDFAVGDNIVDYLLLLQSQQAALSQARDLANRLQESAAELNHQATHDALTGLPNRRLLADRFSQALGLDARNGTSTGLLLVDLDRFKEVNDAFGHHFGDELLQQVGIRIVSTLRDIDTVARLGGDEFAVLLPNAGELADAEGVAARLLAALEAPFRVRGVDLNVEASVGIVISGCHGSDMITLMQHADIAMYVAKTQKLRSYVYHPQADGHSAVKLSLLGDLHRALGRGELLLHYQPKIRINSGDVTGAEALVRWQHPEHGLLKPADFIPLAEQTGLIEPLSRYVLSAAISQARAWIEVGRPLTISVNLSARNLLHAGLPDVIGELLAQHGVPASALELEITESALMSQLEDARRLLGRLAAMGIRISIDDFGAGYTSLGQLIALSVTELKIDRSFVLAMTENQAHATIVRSVIDLGHNLGLTIVAEGVETQQALLTLGAFGCDLAQGYYLCPPLPQGDFDAWCAGKRIALEGPTPRIPLPRNVP